MMKSWKIGHLAGIGIHVHWTFFLLPALAAFQVVSGGGTWAAAVDAVVFLLAVFGCVVLHELGHALMARRFRIATHDITLLPIGGVARLERMPKNPWQELAIAAAGPAVNVAIAVSLAAGLAVSSLVWQMPATATLAGSWFVNLIWVNVALVVFNLLPAFPMDGGRVLRSLLAMRLPYLNATRIAATVGQVLAVGLGLLGLLFNPLLLLVALFVFVAARGEAQLAEREAVWDASDGIHWCNECTTLPAQLVAAPASGTGRAADTSGSPVIYISPEGEAFELGPPFGIVPGQVIVRPFR
jgi:Zn-dependent protease